VVASCDFDFTFISFFLSQAAVDPFCAVTVRVSSGAVGQRGLSVRKKMSDSSLQSTGVGSTVFGISLESRNLSSSRLAALVTPELNAIVKVIPSPI
jgi:hypothetical protein